MVRIRRHDVSEVLILLEEIGSAVRPVDRHVHTAFPSFGPPIPGLRVQQPRISRIHMVGAYVVSKILTAFEKVHLSVTPEYGGIDTGIPGRGPTGPVSGIQWFGVSSHNLIVRNVVLEVFGAPEEEGGAV